MNAGWKVVTSGSGNTTTPPVLYELKTKNNITQTNKTLVQNSGIRENKTILLKLIKHYKIKEEEKINGVPVWK